MRHARLFTLVVVIVGATSGFSPGQALAAPPPDSFKFSIYYSAKNDKQHTDCWCAVAAARVWLNYISGINPPLQDFMAPYMLNHDRYEAMWRETSNRCHQTDAGYEDNNPSYANDSLGIAWTMYHYAGGWGTNGLGFKDFKNGSQDTMNWKIVLGVRSTSWPVAVTVKHGHHELLVVGFETTDDPATYAYADGSIWGFRIWDPWHDPDNSPFNGFTNWPYNGYTGNAYITIDTWNESIFTKDTQEGDYYLNKYVAVLRSASLASPDANPGPSYGDSWFDSRHPSSAMTPRAVSVRDESAAAAASPTPTIGKRSPSVWPKITYSATPIWAGSHRAIRSGGRYMLIPMIPRLRRMRSLR